MAAVIRDVANKAGVSVATVSHVINNTKPVKEKTKAKVLAAIEELSYSPNYLAKSLKENKTKVAGLVIPDISNYFFTEVAKAIEGVLNRNGYNLILCNSNEDLELEIQHIRQLKSYMVSGIIIAAASPEYDYSSLIGPDAYPCVFIDRHVSIDAGDSVTVDGFTAAAMAIDYLIGKGHRSIGFIGAQETLSTTIDRLNGYKNALETRGISIDPELCCFTDGRMISAHNTCRDLLMKRSDVTALFVASSLLSIGTIQYLSESGKRIPDDIALIGYDDYVWARITDPPLSTIRQPTKEIGEIAADLLMRRIADREKESEHIILPAELVMRQSC